MSMYAKVRRMRLRDGLPISEIARRTSLSRNTIKAWLKEPVKTEMVYRRAAAPKKIAAFEAWLSNALETDARRPRKQRRTALRLFEQIREQGFEGDYSRVTAFVRAWRAQGGTPSGQAFVPLHFAWGEAFQFDWSEEGIVIGGVWRKVQLAHMKLCASRAYWLVAYPSQGHEMLFDAHARCFAGLGGIARRGIYDNMKTAVDRVPGRGKTRVVNARFAAMTAHYLFEPDFCNVAAGWEKGRVEKGVQDARRRIWQRAQDEQRFASFAELNVWLATQCVAGFDAEHPEFAGMPIKEALEHEQVELMPAPTPFDGYVESGARVSSTCLVSAARNRYSVPCAYAGARVSVRLYPERVVIVADDGIIAEHARAGERGHVVYDWRHYVPLITRKPGALRNGAPFADLPEPLSLLNRALLRRPGGDQVMAQVLAAIPDFGLEAVLVAVELVLESGRPSAEHVLNVLARLREGVVPQSVETSLSVAEVPLADASRYDRLRLEVAHD